MTRSVGCQQYKKWGEAKIISLAVKPMQWIELFYHLSCSQITSQKWKEYWTHGIVLP